MDQLPIASELVVIVVASTIGVPLLFLIVFKTRGFGGAFPEDVKQQLAREGLLFIVEAVPITTRLRHFRAPGRYSSFSIRSGWGSFAVTKKRVVGYAGRSNCVIDVPLDHTKLAALQIAAKSNSTLSIKFEASDFDDQQSGGVELRYSIGDVSKVLSILRKAS